MSREVCEHFNPVDLPCDKCKAAPIAWYHVPYPNNGFSPMVSLSKQHEPSMYGAVVPLFLGAPHCTNCARLQDQNTELDRKLAEMEAKLNNPSVDDAFRILAEANRRAIDYINELERQVNELKRKAETVNKKRKPLPEEQALDIARTFGAQPWPPGSCVAFARAIEQAHGIGGKA